MSLSVHSAAQNHQLSLVRALVTENPKLIDETDADGRTPLHWAASVGATEVVRYLIDQGTDVTKVDGIGWAALHISASAGHEEIVHELIGAGADVNQRNDKGITPLCDISHRAATTGSTGFISLLLHPPEGVTTKPRLNTGDRVGNTPLHLAMESAHAEVAVLLIEAGADRGRTNVEDITPENVDGVGGEEQRRVKQYVIAHCGPP
ncbi:ankyrin repeat-containing domain protein [Boletus reticuloceps]|uniref:Ankyrin repeat-containing domain protein n=1 Tax=Boletus reticuloceps TaxID=495285 RepID=A0A8I2YD89_9AGAM|nr:ankyrin repeat-containing domain protein [Boletus reticuloceps]